MNATNLEKPVRPATPVRAARASAPPVAPVRLRRTGRGTGPEARPVRRLDPPPVWRSRGATSQGCSVPLPAAAVPVAARPVAARPATQWRLTDRGIALVLITGLLIAAAALSVVGLTALRVTGEHYHHTVGSALVQPTS